jgi:hypothetical protein
LVNASGMMLALMLTLALVTFSGRLNFFIICSAFVLHLRDTFYAIHELYKIYVDARI